jgi:two-component system cell cycle response regulator
VLDWNNVSDWVVLTIDDEPDNLELVAESLEFYGMTVQVANNGVEAIQILETLSPTLVLCDLSMPQMDGWETRTRIKANPGMNTIPVIALSAHAMVGDKERALAAGFDGYLTKPLNIPSLVQDLRAALAESTKETMK